MPARPEQERSAALRYLPPVEEVLRVLQRGPAASLRPDIRLRLVRRTLEELRGRIRAGGWSPTGRSQVLAEAVRQTRAGARRLLASHPAPVINATGVLLHTNLGRAPLSEAALTAVRQAAAGYSDLEYDLEQGRRGSRLARLEDLLVALTGAQAALAVNNNAAAVLLALNTMAAGRQAIVSRGHLVEIGGSFRMPEIMERSGAHMVEVGTTNKTHLKDYEQAIGRRTALLLQVHQSNFVQQGFVQQVPLTELVTLGARHGVPVLDDQGSGVVADPESLGISDEPTVTGSLEAGVAVVTASGDKLLGGPQAGLILGERRWIAEMKSNPLARAVRLDKLQLAALEATVRLYLTDRADREVPLRLLARTPAPALRRRARALAEAITRAVPEGLGVQVIETRDTLGGGSSPDTVMKGWGLALIPRGIPGGATALERALRMGRPAVITRLSEEQVMLSLRSILPVHDTRLPALVARAAARAARARSG